MGVGGICTQSSIQNEIFDIETESCVPEVEVRDPTTPNQACVSVSDGTIRSRLRAPSLAKSLAPAAYAALRLKEPQDRFLLDEFNRQDKRVRRNRRRGNAGEIYSRWGKPQL